MSGTVQLSWRKLQRLTSRERRGEEGRCSCALAQTTCLWGRRNSQGPGKNQPGRKRSSLKEMQIKTRRDFPRSFPLLGLAKIQRIDHWSRGPLPRADGGVDVRRQMGKWHPEVSLLGIGSPGEPGAQRWTPTAAEVLLVFAMVKREATKCPLEAGRMHHSRWSK